MANSVFANGREVACKAANGKTIAAFPDVCFTPPQTPATPPGVPIPYPNTGKASDTTKGSKKVKISNKEVILKNSSYFKTSMGDEAGSAPKKGVVTSKIKGKVYFNAWSMDVKVEGQNVARHMDLTTNNHASMPGDAPPWMYIDSMSKAQLKDCEAEIDEFDKHCTKHVKENTYSTGRVNRAGAVAAMCGDPKCKKAQKCMLVEYGGSGSPNCCERVTGHHLVEAHCFYEAGGRGDAKKLCVTKRKGKQAYDVDKSPTICVQGERDSGKHGQLHAFQQKLEAAHHKGGKGWSYGQAKTAGAQAAAAVQGCNQACIEAQLDAYHKKKCGLTDESRLRTDPDAATRSAGKMTGTQMKKAAQAAAAIAAGAVGAGLG